LDDLDTARSGGLAKARLNALLLMNDGAASRSGDAHGMDIEQIIAVQIFDLSIVDWYWQVGDEQQAVDMGTVELLL
jgi:hypothetical protein